MSTNLDNPLRVTKCGQNTYFLANLLHKNYCTRRKCGIIFKTRLLRYIIHFVWPNPNKTLNLIQINWYAKIIALQGSVSSSRFVYGTLSTSYG